MGNQHSYKLNFVVIFDKNEAHSLLDKAESEDYYIEECHDDRANSVARRNLSYTVNTISLRDINYANSFLDGIRSQLPARLLMELDSVNIIQLMPTADGGMPHTRPGDIICYPNISQLFSKVTLIHELWHIHQRKYKDTWQKTFNRLGWTEWNGKLPDKLEAARRYNPDTIDCPLWIFNNSWVSIPIFRDISRPNVSEVDIWFYNPEKMYHVTNVPHELSNYFPNLPPSAYEHPREITAYILSEPDKYRDSMGFKHLIESVGYTSIVQSENVYN
jgi:hypothetical protein